MGPNLPLIAACAVGLAGVAFVAYRVAFARLLTRQRELEKLLSERAAELEQSKANLQLLSPVDALTLVSSRRHFDETILVEWRRAARSEEPLSLLLVDVDHFQLYREANGQTGADECVKQVAGLLQSEVRRAGELVCRYSYQQFAVILPMTDEKEAETLAEHFRSRLHSVQLANEKAPARVVTLSVGVATARPTGPGHDPRALLRAADEARDQAITAGGNQIKRGSVAP